MKHIYDIKEVETEGTPGRTSDPLAIYIVNTSHNTNEIETQCLLPHA